jgi:hypothetical protein
MGKGGGEMSKLDEAFAVADAIHRSDVFDDPKYSFNFLTLESLGCYPSGPDKATWAASFDAVLGAEWYELREITKYATAARATSPADAILQAAEKFYQLTSTQPTRR